MTKPMGEYVYHASLGPLDEAKIDNRAGRGAVPYNQEVDYFGMRVQMKPSTFLDLAAPLNEKDNSEMEEYIRSGGAIGAPFLDIAIPKEWDDGDFTAVAKIQGHEGRHRMRAIMVVEGDNPIEVHLFPKYYRARDLTPNFVKHINAGLYAEKSSRMVRGPLFTASTVSESDTIKLTPPDTKVTDFIEAVYTKYPQTFQNNHVMPMGGTGDDQQFAMFELTPSFGRRGAVEVKWFQAYPLRQGVGSRAMQELQAMAKDAGIALTLFPWDKGVVSQAKLTKFYKSQGFTPAVKGSKNMAWTPESLDEAFDQPYPMTWEKSEADDSMDALARLPDGSNLSIMFNMEYDEEGEEVVQVEFHRNNSQEVTGDGDAQRVFATVLSAIQQYIKTHTPKRLTFSASKEVEPDQNSESRAKLYDRLVMRYARTWGYRPLRADTGSIVRYELSRLKPVTEAVSSNYLYHATGGLKEILQSGAINASRGPQDSTKAQTKLPTVSVTRDWGYASGSNATAQSGGISRGAVIVLDRNAVEQRYKTLGTSQSRDNRGLAFPKAGNLKAGQDAKSYDTDQSGTLTKADADDVFNKGTINSFGKPASRQEVGQRLGQAKHDYYTPKAGSEFEEAVVVPKGSLPIQGTMVGFWVNPRGPLAKDPTIMNDPRRLDMVRPNQFVKATQQQGVAEAETGTAHADQIEKEFTALGYKLIGSGADSTVWAKNKGHIIKILMPEPGGQAEQVFTKFYEFCLAHQDLECLPVINEHNKISILDREYTQIDMERLSPIKKNSFNEGVVWFFSDFVAGDESWDAVDHALGLADTWTEYNPRQAANLAKYWQDLTFADDNSKFKELHTLYGVMQILYKAGRINKFGWDLHTENVMQRKNGQLVIIDPWFADSALNESVQLPEARTNPDQNTRPASGMKELQAVAETLGDIKNWAISMTAEPKLGINPQVGISEDTPKGIYFYPLNYALGMIQRRQPLPWGNNLPYIQLFQYDRSGEMTKETQVDGAKLKQAVGQYCSEEVIQSAIDEPEYDGTPYWFIYDCLSRLGKSDETNIVRWNKVLRDLGFTSVYDDGHGWIAYNEPTQGVVLDPRVIKQLRTIDNKKESGVITPALIEKTLFDNLDVELASSRAWQAYDPDSSKLKKLCKEWAQSPDFKPWFGKDASALWDEDQKLMGLIGYYRRTVGREINNQAWEWYQAQQAQKTESITEGSGNDIETIIQSFVASPVGQKYKQHDCKTVTRAFVQWAEQNKIPTQVVSLAPPSADFIAKNPRYKGKNGEGDGHIMPIVNGNAIDFTVRQFGVSRPFNNPLVTPTSSLPAVYGKFGYFTDKPEWFLGGKSHWIGALNSIPSEIFNQNFGDELLEHGIMEGGWASAATQDTVITPAIIAEAVAGLDKFAKEYNAWQAQSDLNLEIKMGKPKGSGTYYERDLKQDPTREYGDIDIECFIHSRPGASSAQLITQYKNAIAEFTRHNRDFASDNGTNIIMTTSAGPAQVDLIYTFNEHADWSRALSPEYRVKGVISTSLTSALAEVLNFSFSSQGVQVKTRAGRPVSFRQSKDTELTTVTTNPESWARDMFQYYYTLANGHPYADRLLDLDLHPGLKDEQRLADIVHSIRSLATELERNNLLGNGALDHVADAQTLLTQVSKIYAQKLEAVISSSKFDKAATPAAEEKAKKTKLMLAKYRNEVAKLLLN